MGLLGSQSALEIASELSVCIFGVRDKKEGGVFHVGDLGHKEPWDFVLTITVSSETH